LEEFVRSKSAEDGYSNLCRACKRARSLAYYSKHREEMLPQAREWKANNSERVARGRAAYRQANLEREREHDRQRDATKKRAKDRRYRAKHRAELAAKQRAYWRQRYAGDPEYFIEQRERRLARKMGAKVSDFTVRQWELVKLFYGFRCAYCGCTPAVLHREHVIPLARGGDHTLHNIVPACASCNARKHLSKWLPILRWGERPEDWHSGHIEGVLKQ